MGYVNIVVHRAQTATAGVEGRCRGCAAAAAAAAALPPPPPRLRCRRYHRGCAAARSARHAQRARATSPTVVAVAATIAATTDVPLRLARGAQALPTRGAQAAAAATWRLPLLQHPLPRSRRQLCCRSAFRTYRLKHSKRR